MLLLNYPLKLPKPLFLLLFLHILNLQKKSGVRNSIHARLSISTCWRRQAYQYKRIKKYIFIVTYDFELYPQNSGALRFLVHFNETLLYI